MSMIINMLININCLITWQKMQAPFLRPSMVDALMMSSISEGADDMVKRLSGRRFTYPEEVTTTVAVRCKDVGLQG